MNICISQITTMPSDLPTDLWAFSKAGWSAVELLLDKVDKYLEEHSIEQLQRLLAACNLTAVAAIGRAPADAGLLLESGSALDRFLAELARQLELCRMLRIPCLGVGSDPGTNRNRDWFPGAVRNLRVAGDMAKEVGVYVGLEFMSLAPPIGPFVLSTLAETRALVEAVAHPNVGFNLDLFHHYRGGGKIVDIANLSPDQLIHVHFCDVLGLPMTQLDDGHRVLPEEGDLPLDEIVGALQSCGYKGYLSLELLNEALWKEDPVVVAQRGWASMQRFVNNE